MDRREFLSLSGAAGIASVAGAGSAFAQQPAETKAPAKPPPAAEGEFTAGSGPGPIFAGSPVVTGPAHDAITILQPIARHATGHLEYAIEDGAFQRVDTEAAGLLPLEPYVLKFRLPALPPGKNIRYRIVARTIGWVRVREFFHGEIKPGDPQTSDERKFRTLDPAAEKTTFAVWNDTHENLETLKSLHAKTAALKPDFLLWNGDQTNDLHYEKDMNNQFLAPGGLAIADAWPLAYVRGNHDVRGPEAHRLPRFTGTPGDRFYYAFRSGPVAALVMDTGEDKPDDSPYFASLAAFQVMQKRQAEWLKVVTKEAWFKDAPHKVLFCHIPLFFTRDIFPKYQRWEMHDVCRRLWLDSLVEAGVKLIVSGHTHDPRWMPAKEGQPISQLIGGAPWPKGATYIEGEATMKTLKLTMTSLAGKVLADVKFDA